MTIEARKIRLIMHLRRSGVVDTAVLSALERIPREAFLPPTFHDQAYEDMALPIGLGQTISQPLIVALMTQALEVQDRMKVLEIGTGSGYQTAVLAKLARRVYTIERHRPLLVEAEQRLKSLRIHNVTSKWGDGIRGWPEQAPFDRIIVTAAAGTEPPKDLTDQLSIGGLLVIPLAVDRRDQRVVRFRRTEDGLAREDLWPVRFVPLLPDLPDAAERKQP
ncbi:MAG TPA: protein-L-isoaspartate(D-aspartate) O-methyltransferase [Azospirillaceae bacterium]|nr:protein-L-isoaspartate(D-aspartate) O-methyltransferase [Azospirillaceae bacterium]